MNPWRKIREDMGWPQTKLAKKAGLKQPQISNIERGLKPTPKQVKKLLRAFSEND